MRWNCLEVECINDEYKKCRFTCSISIALVSASQYMYTKYAKVVLITSIMFLHSVLVNCNTFSVLLCIPYMCTPVIPKPLIIHTVCSM